MYRDEKAWGEPLVQPVDAVGQILLKAADLIEQEGWCQHRGAKEGARCALQAVYDAAGAVGCGLAWDRLRSVVGCISVWNDAPSTTKAQVINIIRKAAHVRTTAS
jgi:hypothetical protein